jgi:hypothetical protein
MRDDTPYDGVIIPEIGPYPLVQGVSFPSFEGSTFSSMVSSHAGALMHEMTHGFSLQHDSRHDANFHGNLMFNGLRGVRGALFPDRYPNDHTRLAYTTALTLRVIPYMTACELVSVPFETGGGESAAATTPSIAPTGLPEKEHDEVQLDCIPEVDAFVPEAGQMGAALSGSEPSVTILTSGSVTPVNGKIQIDFTAVDPDGLWLAGLKWPSSLIGELELFGTTGDNETFTFETHKYTPGVSNEFTVKVYDVLGNRTTASTTIIPAAGFDQAPNPHFRVLPAQAAPGESVLFDGSNSSDPEEDSIEFMWEFDQGQGFTPASSEDSATNVYTSAGTPLARLQVQESADPDIRTTSTPIAIRIGGSCANGIDDDGDGYIDYPADIGCLGATSAPENPQCSDGLDNDGDGKIDFDGGVWAGVPEPTAPDPHCSAAWDNLEAFQGKGGCGAPTVQAADDARGLMALAPLAIAMLALLGYGIVRNRRPS